MEAGFGFRQMLIVHGSLFLIHYFDWRIANFALGLFLLVLILPVAAILIRNDPSEKGMSPIGGFIKDEDVQKGDKKAKNFSIWEVMRKRQFWFLILPFAFCGFTTTGLMDTHLIPYSHNHGFSTTVTSAAVSILAAFNIIGILCSGVIIDH